MTKTCCYDEQRLSPAFSFVLVPLFLLGSYLHTAAQSSVNLFSFPAPQNFATASPYEFLYRIPVDSVYRIVYQRKTLDIHTPWLDKPAHVVPRYRVDSVMNTGAVSPGYYLVVSANQNTVSVYIRRKQGFKINMRDLREFYVLTATDMDEESTEVITHLADKAIAYDSAYAGYRIRPRYKGNKILTVRKGNDICFVDISRNKRPAPYYDPYENYYRPPYEPPREYTGYFVTNQPKYLPGDTVKYKAYVLHSNAYHQKEPVKLSLFANYREFVIKDTLYADGVGAYYGEFVLGDSVKPGMNCMLQMRGLKSGQTISQTFLVEDYVLDRTVFRVTGAGERMFQPGDSLRFFASALTANGMPVLDGTVRITILPQITDYATPQPLFIPDTLYDATVPTDPSGETNIGFGTENFPVINMGLRCQISFVNANFERKDTVIYRSFTRKEGYLRTTVQDNNVLLVEAIRHQKSVAGKGTLSINGKLARSIEYPFTDTISDNVYAYNFTLSAADGGIADSYNHKVSNDGVKVITDFRRDTAYFFLRNPSRTLFRYVVYRGERFMGYGQVAGDTLMKIYSPKGRTVTVLGNYTWMGQSKNERYEIAKGDKTMLVDVAKKDVVYPGQKDTIGIHVADKDGNPLAATNLTVLAFNAEFKEDYTPTLPDFSIYAPGVSESAFITFTNERSYNNYLATYPVTMPWLVKCGADTMFFYDKLLFNKNKVAWYLFNIQDAMPRIAIHAHRKGVFTRPTVIYIDGKPVYMGALTNTTNPEALAVSEGIHNIILRFADAEYTINNVPACRNTKLNLILDLDRAEEDTVVRFVTKRPAPDSFSTYEKDVLVRYTLLYRPEGYREAIITQPEIDGYSLYPASKRGVTYIQRPAEEAYSVGPLNMRDSIGFFQNNNVKMKFMPELHQVFTLRPGMMRLAKQSAYDFFNVRLNNHPYWPSWDAYIVPRYHYDSLHLDTPKPVVVVYSKEKRYTIKLPVYKRPDSAGATLLIPTQSTTFKRLVISKAGTDTEAFLEVNRWQYQCALKPGKYNICAIRMDDSFIVVTDLELRAGGTTIVPLGVPNKLFDYEHPPKFLLPYLVYGYDSIPELQYRDGSAAPSDYYAGYGGNTGRITGLVVDENKEPVIGAIVEVNLGGIVKGGAVTDVDGMYVVKPLMPGKYNVKISYSSYKTVLTTGVLVQPDRVTRINAALEWNPARLEEVAITSYKVPLIDRYEAGGAKSMTSEEIERMPTRNTASMAATSAGVYQQSEGSISVQGARSDGTTYVIDGVQVLGQNARKRGDEPGTNFSKSAKAQKHLEAFLNDMMAASGMRKDFRDWAIWQPNLWTDKSGKVSFDVTYPGNTTSWKTYVLAMNQKGFAGSVFTLTRAYKPLSAELFMPRFLRYGDSVEVVGKVANYTDKPFALHTFFTRNGAQTPADSMTVNNAKVDRWYTYAPGNNSIDTALLTLSYALKMQTGYTDGEEKSIPVYPVGTIQTEGDFVPMFADTILHLRPDTSKGYFTGKTRVYVNGSMLEVMLDEIERLKEYPYGCTEQLTTKLLAIYYEEEVKHIMGNTKLNNTKAKREILEKLVVAQKKNGSFGWWPGTDADYRITNYVISTMYKINKDGWLDFVIRRGLGHLAENLSGMSRPNLITSMATLSAAGYAADYKLYTDKLPWDSLSTYDKAVLIKICKEQSLPYRSWLDTLVQQANKTYDGMYIGTHGYDWYRNDLAATLKFYDLVKDDSVYANLKEPVMRYLLFKRRNGYYANTAESGLVLTQLLPELLKNNSVKGKPKPTTIAISGSINDTVSKFPAMYELNNKQVQLSFDKKGFSPTFVSVVYDYFNMSPQAKKGSFDVHSFFIKSRDTLTALKQGERVVFRTTVTADKDADYVMIEIPIPAGCMQSARGNKWYRWHREDYKDKTVIFCPVLSAGTHTFDVELEARYKGVYNVNPAKAEMMYYPQEYGNTQVKRIEVK